MPTMDQNEFEEQLRRLNERVSELSAKQTGYTLPSLPSLPTLEPSKLRLIYALLSAYCLAGCLMEHFTVFHAWQLTTSDSDLKRIQNSTGKRTLYLYVIPKVVVTLLALYHIGDDRLEGLCIACLAISWLSSFALQIPMQLEIREGASRVALGRLVQTTWIRTLAMIGHCLALFYVVLVNA